MKLIGLGGSGIKSKIRSEIRNNFDILTVIPRKHSDW